MDAAVRPRYPDGGIDPWGIDVAGGRIVATLVQSRSTGRLNGLADRVVVLSGQPSSPRFWSSPRWDRHVLTADAAVTAGRCRRRRLAGGRGPAYGEAVVRDLGAHRTQPSVYDLGWRTTLTDGAVSGDALDLSVTADGHGAIAYVRHRRVPTIRPSAARRSVVAATAACATRSTRRGSSRPTRPST